VHRRGIRIGGARVEGQLDLAHGEVMTPLAFTSCLFDHSVSLTATRLPEFDLRGSHLPSLTADRMRVAGSVYLGHGFTTTGTVALQAAVIGDQLNCRGGRFQTSYEDGMALLADRIDVAAEVLLDEGFTAFGEVRFAAARIGRTLTCSAGSFNNPSGAAFHGNGMTVGGQWIVKNSRFDGTLSVKGASIGILNDDVDGWPQGWRGEAFAFRDFAADAELGAAKRIRWLEGRGGGFWPPHYTSLSQVYRRRGDPESARAVLIAREQGRTTQLPRRRRLVRRLWGTVAAYGYRPQRAVWGLGLLIALAGLGFAFADMRPTTDVPPQFWSVMYAADLALPLIDLRQADSYQPENRWAQGLMYATIMVGWFLSGAFVAAVTGLFKPDE
jgi:hypothetical protein